MTSLLQIRNLAYNYSVMAPPPDTSEEDFVRFMKNAFRNANVPTEIMNDVTALQALPLVETTFKAALVTLYQKIDTLIPQLHTPTSLDDIASELVRISRATYSLDRDLLSAGYAPMILPYVGPVAADTVSKIQTRTGLETFPVLQGIYQKYRASLQLARSDAERTSVTATYDALVTSGTLTPTWTLPVSTNVLGFYGPSFDPTQGTFQVYFTEPTPGLNISNGWTIQGLTGINGTVSVRGYKANVYSDALISVGPPAISFPFVSNALVTSDQPNLDIRPSSILRMTLFPPAISNVSNVIGETGAPSFGYYDERVFDTSGIVGKSAPVRDLSSNVMTSEGRPVYHTVVDRGAGTGALIGLAAIGAQDPYLFGGQSLWIPTVKTHTPFALTQRLSLPLSNVGGYLGNTTQVDLRPRECGDLLSNMYLQCSLPAGTYTELVGRAILKKVEFLVDGVVYESITDDWYVIHDQLFLDADEKLGMYQLVSNGTPEGSNVVSASTINLLIPLDFFFCQRYTHGRSREKPYFPLCAVTLSTVSVRFTFNTQAWITSSGTPFDLINPRLLIEEIHLGPEERMYYQSKTFTYKVPRVWKEATQNYTNGLARLSLTATFPVTMMVWFVRNKKYESTSNAYYESRYSYGYTTKYIQSATPVTFFNGVSLRYIDIIDYATLYLNNNNVLSNFPGGLYYTFKQALDHGLSVPTKSLYMYCFGERPMEYNQGGAVNFKNLSAQTTHLDIKFLDTYASQIQSEFSLNLYYYGYVTLQIRDGRCTLLN